MDEYRELVKRLRGGIHLGTITTLGGVDHETRCLEAADAIEALLKRVEELERDRIQKVNDLAKPTQTATSPNILKPLKRGWLRS